MTINKIENAIWTLRDLPINALRGLKFLATKIDDSESSKENLKIEVENYLKNPLYLSIILKNIALLTIS